MNVSIRPAGETCFFVDFGEAIDLQINGQVQALKETLLNRPFTGMKELVPTYRSLSVYFDPLITDLPNLRKRLEKEIETPAQINAEGGTEIAIPVCYGGEFGPDMANVTSHTGLSEEEVIQRHSASNLYCYMVGFTPGFPYLGGMDPLLTTPRLPSPREVIPAGSVGIAGSQTGAYSIVSPGGWQLIGRTPVKLYDPEREPAVAIQDGMWVRFYAVSPQQYQAIEAQIKAGNYELEISERREPS